MSPSLRELRRIEFEARIFVSFAIVAVVVVLSEVVFGDRPRSSEPMGALVGLDTQSARRLGYAAAIFLLLAATVLRMWAGTVLTSTRVMAFGVQDDALETRGPYRLTRNPIYLADFVAFVGFAFVLRPVGVLLPALLYLHYRSLIAHEEDALRRSFGAGYASYLETAASLARLPRALRELEISRDGVRHNALYVLFLPGLAVAAATGSFWHALAIGLPGTLDWAVVHTRIGLPRRTRRKGA